MLEEGAMGAAEQRRFLTTVQAVASILQATGVRLREAGAASVSIEVVLDTPYGGTVTVAFEDERPEDDDDPEEAPGDPPRGGESDRVLDDDDGEL